MAESPDRYNGDALSGSSSADDFPASAQEDTLDIALVEFRPLLPFEAVVEGRGLLNLKSSYRAQFRFWLELAVQSEP